MPSTTHSREDILTGIMEYLDDPNFTFKVRYMYVKNKHDVPIKRVLQQIVLIDNNQKTLAKRFTSHFCTHNGATFNTNATKLLLSMTVGVTNTNQSLLAAFSFSTQASEIFYNSFETCKMEKEKGVWGRGREIHSSFVIAKLCSKECSGDVKECTSYWLIE